MAYDNTNTFILFQHDKKGNEKAPERSGTLNVDGVEYFIDGWIKQGAKGPFLSGRIKLKDDPSRAAAPVKKSKPFDPEDDGQIPF